MLYFCLISWTVLDNFVCLFQTRMQSLTPNAGHIQSIRSVLSRMLWVEGANRMVRGMGPVVCGAGPAHALYFSCYEAAKSSLTQKSAMLNNHVAYCKYLTVLFLLPVIV